MGTIIGDETSDETMTISVNMKENWSQSYRKEQNRKMKIGYKQKYKFYIKNIYCISIQNKTLNKIARDKNLT